MVEWGCFLKEMLFVIWFVNDKNYCMLSLKNFCGLSPDPKILEPTCSIQKSSFLVQLDFALVEQSLSTDFCTIIYTLFDTEIWTYD